MHIIYGVGTRYTVVRACVYVFVYVCVFMHLWQRLKEKVSLSADIYTPGDAIWAKIGATDELKVIIVLNTSKEETKTLANIYRASLAVQKMFETFYTFITTPLCRNSRRYTPGLVRVYSFRFFFLLIYYKCLLFTTDESKSRLGKTETRRTTIVFRKYERANR